MTEPARRRSRISTDISGGVFHLVAEIGALLALLVILGAIAWLVTTLI